MDQPCLSLPACLQIAWFKGYIPSVRLQLLLLALWNPWAPPGGPPCGPTGYPPWRPLCLLPLTACLQTAWFKGYIPSVRLQLLLLALWSPLGSPWGASLWSPWLPSWRPLWLLSWYSRLLRLPWLLLVWVVVSLLSVVFRPSL